MAGHAAGAEMERLDVLVGEWSMAATVPGAPADGGGARTVFEWGPGGRFLVQRWEIPHPEAPDGIAIITDDEGPGTYIQHYFDSRGVVRLYRMTLEGDEWRLWRTEADFTPLSFSQRFTGRLSEGWSRIEATWEISRDGTEWERDFDLTYTRRT